MEKTVINGDVIFDPLVDYSEITEITDYLDCRGADTKTAFPKLTAVGGSLNCRGANTSAAFPRLATIGGPLNCNGANTKTSFPDLTTIGGYLYCSGANTSAAFPNLTVVGGFLYCRGADTKAAFPRLTTVGGILDCRGADTKTAFPKLKQTQVGGASAKSKIEKAFKRKNYLLADGILAHLVETKQLKSGAEIHKIVVVGKTKTSYCIKANGTFSHGSTIKEARESLLYKIGKRDKSEYEGWTLDTNITKKEAIESYRVITGACEAGVRSFVQSHSKLKEKYSVREIIDITRGQYRSDEYADFFERS